MFVIVEAILFLMLNAIDGLFNKEMHYVLAVMLIRTVNILQQIR